MEETLEEVVEKLFPVFNRSTPFGSKYPWTPHKEREAFKKGIKWQQERSYTLDQISKNFIGENTYGYFDEYLDYRLNFNNENSEHKRPTFKEWFEQFKKK